MRERTAVRDEGLRLRRPRLAISILALAIMWGADVRTAASDSAAAGIWMTDDGDGAVEVRPCGNELCGYIYAILHLPNPSLPALDDRNQNAELRSRPLCGMQVIGGLRAMSPGKWSGGWIYDPKVGKTYGLDLTFEDQHLSVHGYLQGTFLGRTVSWSRAATPPSKCVAPQPKR
jgi:uncharacterized protein (DUF2147 family)